MQNKIDWSEFLKNRDGKESADRLLLLLSFPVASYLALKIGTAEALGVYLAAYGALAANNKWADKNAVSNDSQEVLVDNSSSTDSVASEPLARESKPIGKRTKRPF